MSEENRETLEQTAPELQDVPAEEIPENGKKKKGKKSVGREILSWVFCILGAVAIALVIRSFIFEPVRVDGHSMDDTLANGEIMFVSKFDYSSTWLSLPWQSNEAKEDAPRFTFGGNPNRFDVVICRYPGRGDANFVKRVIGLPGDLVEIRDKILYVNDEPYSEPYVSEEYRVRGGSNGETYMATRVPAKGDVIEVKDQVVYLNGEAFPGETQYFGIVSRGRRILIDRYGRLIIEEKDGTQLQHTEDLTLTVEQDNYMVMGDHRNNSNDSRAQGCITRDMIVGHVRCILFPPAGWRDVLNGLDYPAE